MKKQILLITALLFVAAGSFSQIVLNNITNQYFTSDLTSSLDAHLDVENTSATPVEIMIIRTIESKTPQHDELFCFGLYCYNPSTDTSLYSTTLAGNSSDGTFKPQITPNGVAGYDRFKYLFYDLNNPLDSVSVTIEFFIGVSGLNENTQESYLKFNNLVNNFTVLNYKLPSTANNARIDIHNMLGSKMNSYNITEKQGMKMVSTSNFSNGVYLVSLIVNNKTTSSYKMIVNHQKGN